MYKECSGETLKATYGLVKQIIYNYFLTVIHFLSDSR